MKWNVNIKGEKRMGLGYKNNINAAVTAVSNTFIDEYMGTASGEYVKVTYIFCATPEKAWRSRISRTL